MALVGELKRRNVFRVAAAYLVVGWLLTEVLTTILPTLGAPDWTARAVILVFALGFIPAVVLSWVYELTPEGIKRDHDVSRKGAVTNSKPFNYTVIGSVVALIIVLGVLGARQTGDDDTVAPEVNHASVAVLPFVNMSSDEDNEYFSDGLTETLLHMLAQIPDLQVAARTSSFAFKGRNADVQDIAAALRVAHILEGSVQKVGNQIRVTAQLIRASDGFHVWSSNYDRTVDDIFAIQDEIANEVGQELSQSLLGDEKGPQLVSVGTSNTDAYDLYLQALKERSTGSFGALEAAENLLKGALVIDPDFVDAKNELAELYLLQAETGLVEKNTAFVEIAALTEQVLAADGANSHASALASFVAAADAAKDENAEPLFDAIEPLEKSLARQPDDYRIRFLLTRLYQTIQENERALELQLQAHDIDPYNARILYELGSLYTYLDQWDQARDALTKSLDIEAKQPNAYVRLAQVSLNSGDGLEYLQYLLKAMAVDPRDHELPGMIASFLYSLELFEAGDEFRDRVIAIAPTSSMAYHIELSRAVRSGDEAAIVASARRAIEDDVEQRMNAYAGSVRHLLRIAAKNGTFEEESDWLDSVAPGILDVDSTSAPLKYRDAQAAALDAWYTVLPREELLVRIDKILAFADTFGIDPLAKPQSRIAVMALRGEVEEATEFALQEVLSQPVVSNLRWRHSLVLPQYENIVADARVRQALQRWDDEWLALQARVSSYLEDLSSAS